MVIAVEGAVQVALPTPSLSSTLPVAAPDVTCSVAVAVDELLVSVLPVMALAAKPPPPLVRTLPPSETSEPIVTLPAMDGDAFHDALPAPSPVSTEPAVAPPVTCSVPAARVGVPIEAPLM